MIKYLFKYNFVQLLKIFFFELLYLNKNFNFYFFKSKNNRYFDHIPTPYYYLSKIYIDIKNLKLKKKYFIDLGCGTGRALNFFYQKGFKKMIGIEQSKKIFSICKNINKKNKIIFYNKDIKNYVFPREAGIFYLYNPGPINLIKKIIKKILKKKYKNLIIIYVAPVYLKYFDKKYFKTAKKAYDQNFRGYIILKIKN